MLASTEFIPLVVKLGHCEQFRTFKMGSHLVRGYADLGHEEFILVGEGKLVSLFTGTPSTLPEGHEHFFARVPTIDEMTNVLLRQNFDITNAEYKGQRSWVITAQHIENGNVIKAEHAEFECALAQLLLSIFKK